MTPMTPTPVMTPPTNTMSRSSINVNTATMKYNAATPNSQMYYAKA